MVCPPPLHGDLINLLHRLHVCAGVYGVSLGVSLTVCVSAFFELRTGEAKSAILDCLVLIVA